MLNPIDDYFLRRDTERWKTTSDTTRKRNLARTITARRMRLALDPDSRVTRHPELYSSRYAHRRLERTLQFRDLAKAIKAKDIRAAVRAGSQSLITQPRKPGAIRDFVEALQAANNRMKEDWMPLQYDTAGMDFPVVTILELLTLTRQTFAHVSVDDASKIAYYPTVADLLRDRCIRTTMGKFLTKFVGPNSENPLLTELQIKTIAERYANRQTDVGEVFFVEDDDPSGWEDVYREGPGSCMHGEDCVRIYARKGNGLRLAYIVDADETPIGRCIVREDTDPPQYVRVYPNPDDGDKAMAIHTQFKAKLETMGYEHGNLDGVKLAYEECDNGIVAPYIDTGNRGSQSADIGYDSQGQYLRITECGDLRLTETCGYVENENLHECDECGSRYDADEEGSYSEYHNMNICDHCARNRFITAIINRRGHEDLVREGEVIRCESDDNYYAEDIANECDVYQCADSDEWYHIDDLVQCDAGRYEGDFIRADSSARDHLTGEIVHEDEVTDTPDGEVFDENLETCCVTGGERHREYLLKIRVLRETFFVDLEACTLADFAQKFVVSGKPGVAGMIMPRGYYGREVSVNEYWHTPVNATHGEHMEVGLDDFLESLTEVELFTDEPMPSREHQYALALVS